MYISNLKKCFFFYTNILRQVKSIRRMPVARSMGQASKLTELLDVEVLRQDINIDDHRISLHDLFNRLLTDPVTGLTFQQVPKTFELLDIFQFKNIFVCRKIICEFLKILFFEKVKVKNIYNWCIIYFLFRLAPSSSVTAPTPRPRPWSRPPGSGSARTSSAGSPSCCGWARSSASPTTASRRGCTRRCRWTTSCSASPSSSASSSPASSPSSRSGRRPRSRQSSTSCCPRRRSSSATARSC